MDPRKILNTVVLFALGCTARAGGGTGGPLGVDVVIPGVDVVTPGVDAGTPGATCDTLCARLTGVAGCTSTSVAACVSSCQQLSSSPPTCQLAAMGLRACLSTATVNCSSPSLPFAGCDAQVRAYGGCVVGTLTDGGVIPTQDVVIPDDPCASATTCGACASRSSCGWCDDRCSLGTSSGPAGRTCQRTPWAWTTGACSNPITDSRINNPLISPMCQACAASDCTDEAARCLADTSCRQCLSGALTPSCRENDAVIEVLTCACSSCSTECRTECASLGL